MKIVSSSLDGRTSLIRDFCPQNFSGSLQKKATDSPWKKGYCLSPVSNQWTANFSDDVPQGKQKLRVLVVDDNEDAAVTLALMLDFSGFDANTEYGPSAALARSDIQTFDVFVLDIGLPEMDGYMLARQLKATLGCENALFVAVTGYGSDEARKCSSEAGFHHHFTKPVNLAIFLKALQGPRFGT